MKIIIANVTRFILSAALVLVFLLPYGGATAQKKSTSSDNAGASAVVVGQGCLNLGVGFLSSLSYSNYGFGGSASVLPAFFLSYDRGVMDLGPGVLTIGGGLGFQHASYSYDDLSGYNYGYSWNDFTIGARGLWHLGSLLKTEKADVYGGIQLGARIATAKTTSNYAYYTGTSSTGFNAYYSLIVGGKYFFTPKFGVFGELGYDIAYLKLGLSINL